MYSITISYHFISSTVDEFIFEPRVLIHFQKCYYITSLSRIEHQNRLWDAFKTHIDCDECFKKCLLHYMNLIEIKELCDQLSLKVYTNL